MFNIQLSNKTRHRPPFRPSSSCYRPEPSPRIRVKHVVVVWATHRCYWSDRPTSPTSIYLQYTNLVLAMKGFLSGTHRLFPSSRHVPSCFEIQLCTILLREGSSRRSFTLPGVLLELWHRTRAGPFSDTIALHAWAIVTVRVGIRVLRKRRWGITKCHP